MKIKIKSVFLALAAITMVLSACTQKIQESVTPTQTEVSAQSQGGTYIGILGYGDHANISDEHKFNYPSTYDLEQQYMSYWKSELSGNVKFLDSRPVLTGYDEAHGWSKDYDIYLRYYKLDKDLIPVIYQTIVHCVVGEDMKVYAKGTENVTGDSVKTAEQGRKLNVFPMTSIADKWIEGQEQGMTLAALLSERKQTDELKNPVTAFERIVHPVGGSVTANIPAGDDSVCLVYTFADGSHLNYVMRKYGEYWFVLSIIKDEYADGYRQAEKYVSNATASRLRGVTKTLYSKDYKDKVYELNDDFLLLGEAPESDAALYGLYGMSAMILRVGDNVYPVWKSFSDRGVEFACGDYDKDGVTEYSYSTCEGHGTGVSIYGLKIMEISKDNELSIHDFDNADELMKRVTWRLDDTAGTIYWYVDGMETRAASDIGKSYEGNGKAALKAVDLSSIRYMEYENGEWYMKVHAGIVYEPNVTGDYVDGIIITSHVTYDRDTFTLDNIRFGNAEAKLK